MKHIRNLVFEGGGVKGIAYSGALKVLKQQGILDDCVRFAGTSAGAITAWLCAYYKEDLAQIEKIQRETDFSSFADDEWGIIRDADRLLNRYGWHKGDTVYAWAQQITRQRFGRDNISFQSLFDETGNDLVIIGCNVSKGKSVFFSKDATPDFYVERALRISMSIPIYFRGIFIADDSVDASGNIVGNPAIDKEINRNRDIFVDGGVLDNFPIQTFDVEPYTDNPVLGEVIELLPSRSPSCFNKSTLGFRVDSSDELRLGNIAADSDQFKAQNFFKYVLGLADLLHQATNKKHLDDYDWHRTIRINALKVKSTDFSLDSETQDALIEKGQEATKKYLTDYNDSWLNYYPD